MKKKKKKKKKKERNSQNRETERGKDRETVRSGERETGEKTSQKPQNFCGFLLVYVAYASWRFQRGFGERIDLGR